MTTPEREPLTDEELGAIRAEAVRTMENGFCEPECDAADCSYHRVSPNTLRLLAEHAAQRERIAELEREQRYCLCQIVTPCDERCTCVKAHSSFGCRRCARYGSQEQRLKGAAWLASVIDAARKPTP